jgi:hypothetical protein
MSLTLSEYRELTRFELSDDDSIVAPHHPDSKLNFAINLARKTVNQELKLYQAYNPIIPELYIDEYTLPTDYLSPIKVVDVEDEVELTPIAIEQGEILDDSYYTLSFGNLFVINTRKRTITFLDPPDSDLVPPAYTIDSSVGTAFDFTNNKIIVNAVEAGYVLNQIGKWNDSKGYIKVTVNDGSDDYIQYCRYSKIVYDETNDEYTIYIPSWNILDDTTIDNSTLESTFTSGTVKFVPYIMYYYANPPKLVNDDDVCQLPNDAQELVAIYSAFQLYLREGDSNKANAMWSRYEVEKQKVLSQINESRGVLYNQHQQHSRGRRWMGNERYPR